MRALVGKDIRIIESDSYTRNFFSSMLTFANPEYERALRSGRWTGRIPKTLSLIERDGDDIIIPYGMLDSVLHSVDRFESVDFLFGESRTVDYKSKISLLDYQKGAVDSALENKHGVIVAPCGSGKTQIGLEIAARVGKKTLWLTHTVDLMEQAFTRALSCFEVAPESMGFITGGKIDIGSSITFATVQTMSNIDLRKFEDAWDVVIVDECHHVAGTPTKLMMFYKVISSLNARWKFGLTATPKRNDGLTNTMFALLGRKIYEISKGDVANSTCPVRLIQRRVQFYPPSKIFNPDGTINYPRLINAITDDTRRTLLIAADVASADGQSLVLTDRVHHGETIKNLLDKMDVPCAHITGNASLSDKRKRNGILNDMREGNIKVLIATYALAKEGLDIPSLNNVFFATPQKTESVIIQSAGRVARAFKGKEYGTVYDYVDSFPMLTSWGERRKKILKKLE